MFEYCNPAIAEHILSKRHCNLTAYISVMATSLSFTVWQMIDEGHCPHSY